MRWKTLALVAVVAAVAALGGVLAGVRLGSPGGLQAQPSTLTGGSFVLLDGGGIQRGVLEVTPDGTSRLIVTGRNSQTPSVTVAVSPAGVPSLTLTDELGAPRVTSEVGADGTIIGLLGGRNLTVRAGLSVGPDGRTGLDLRDPQNRVRASLSIAADGTPSLAFFDEDGDEVWSAP